MKRGQHDFNFAAIGLFNKGIAVYFVHNYYISGVVSCEIALQFFTALGRLGDFYCHVWRESTESKQ